MTSSLEPLEDRKKLKQKRKILSQVVLSLDKQISSLPGDKLKRALRLAEQLELSQGSGTVESVSSASASGRQLDQLTVESVMSDQNFMGNAAAVVDTPVKDSIDRSALQSKQIFTRKSSVETAANDTSLETTHNATNDIIQDSADTFFDSLQIPEDEIDKIMANVMEKSAKKETKSSTVKGSQSLYNSVSLIDGFSLNMQYLSQRNSVSDDVLSIVSRSRELAHAIVEKLNAITTGPLFKYVWCISKVMGAFAYYDATNFCIRLLFGEQLSNSYSYRLKLVGNVERMLFVQMETCLCLLQREGTKNSLCFIKIHSQSMFGDPEVWSIDVSDVDLDSQHKIVPNDGDGTIIIILKNGFSIVSMENGTCDSLTFEDEILDLQVVGTFNDSTFLVCLLSKSIIFLRTSHMSGLEIYAEQQYTLSNGLLMLGQSKYEVPFDCRLKLVLVKIPPTVATKAGYLSIEQVSIPVSICIGYTGSESLHSYKPGNKSTTAANLFCFTVKKNEVSAYNLKTYKKAHNGEIITSFRYLEVSNTPCLLAELSYHSNSYLKTWNLLTEQEICPSHVVPHIEPSSEIFSP